jgi:hypothetical protein
MRFSARPGHLLTLGPLTVLLPTLTWATQQERERRSVLPLLPGEASLRTGAPESAGRRPVRERAWSRVRVLLPGRKQQRARACASDLTRFG